ncbi:MAG: exodeoxyribonuclease V subunit gamma [Arenimonas sp.]|nr:exodeoxyribonuclease V subunit gamma [Arenimonas sp.]MBP7981375.1 exodeoxyribonuclease V subunit gamma [Arenimonas sp.]
MFNPSGFTLHHSNRLPVLAKALGICMAQPHAGPLLSPDMILIPQPSMRRWLQNSLAEQFGIAANIEFQPPSAFINRMLDPWLPDAGPSTLLNPDSLRWVLFQHLQSAETMSAAVFQPIQAFMQADNRQLRAWQLSGELAQTFEKYQAWRKQWLLAWHTLESKDDWQAALWHKASAGKFFRAQSYAAYLDYAGSTDALVPEGLPARLFVFACQTLSPDALRVITSFARWSDVHFFMHNPCKNYWGDIGRPKNSADILALQGDNPLLNRWGFAGRDFVASLLSEQGTDWAAEFAYYPPASTAVPSLLQRVQTDVLERRAPSVCFDSFSSEGLDGSIQIHSTHTHLRAVQVLRAQLLGLLAKDPTLQWRDIAIMAPNLEDYAPYFAPVFGQRGDGYPELSFSLSDLNVLRQSSIAELFFRLLDLSQSRFSSNEGFDLLSHVYVAGYFGLQAEDLQRIHYWLDAAAVRWGLDAQHRMQTDGVSQQAFTWRHGLQRLLYGYASEDAQQLDGTASASVLIGKDQAVLDALFEFVDGLDHLRDSLRQAKSPAQWVILLQGLLTRFIEPSALDDAELEAFNQLNLRIAALQEFTGQAGFKQALELQVVRSYLEDEGEQRMSQAWLSGRITLCKMVPMRLIPFKVICLLGMDEAAFPRQEASAAINRINAAQAGRQLGDRSNRSDDRFLFLQLLCACQSNLLLFYHGRNPHNHAESQPSVLIKELIDCLSAYYPDPESTTSNWPIQHPIHAFEAACDARAVSLLGVKQAEQKSLPLFAPIAENVPKIAREAIAPEGAPTISLDEIIRFWQKPMESLAKTLRIRLPEHEVLLDEHEPYGQAAGLDKYQLLQQIVAYSLKREPPDAQTLLLHLQAAGQLAPGAAGHVRFQQLYGSVQDALALLSARKITPVQWPFSLVLGNTTLHGRFVQHFQDGVYHLHLNGKMKGRDHIESGLGALVARACGLQLAFFDFTEKAVPRTMGLSPEQAQAELAGLLDLYQQGQSRILPFHRSYSFAFHADWRSDPELDARQWLEQTLLEEQDSEHAEMDGFGDFLTYGDGFLKRVALADPDGFAALSKKVCGLLLGESVDD